MPSKPPTGISGKNSCTAVAAAADKTVKVWNLDGKEIASFTAPADIKGVAFAPDGSRIAVGRHVRGGWRVVVIDLDAAGRPQLGDPLVGRRGQFGIPLGTELGQSGLELLFDSHLRGVVDLVYGGSARVAVLVQRARRIFSGALDARHALLKAGDRIVSPYEA